MNNNIAQKKQNSDLNIISISGIAMFLFILILFSVGHNIISTTDEDFPFIKIETQETTKLRNLHTLEENILNSFQLLDPDIGKYRIPINLAMELIAEEANQ